MAPCMAWLVVVVDAATTYVITTNGILPRPSSPRWRVVVSVSGALTHPPLSWQSSMPPCVAWWVVGVLVVDINGASARPPPSWWSSMAPCMAWLVLVVDVITSSVFATNGLSTHMSPPWWRVLLAVGGALVRLHLPWQSSMMPCMAWWVLVVDAVTASIVATNIVSHRLSPPRWRVVVDIDSALVRLILSWWTLMTPCMAWWVVGEILWGFFWSRSCFNHPRPHFLIIGGTVGTGRFLWTKKWRWRSCQHMHMPALPSIFVSSVPWLAEFGFLVCIFDNCECKVMISEVTKNRKREREFLNSSLSLSFASTHPNNMLFCMCVVLFLVACTMDLCFRAFFPLHWSAFEH